MSVELVAAKEAIRNAVPGTRIQCDTSVNRLECDGYIWYNDYFRGLVKVCYYCRHHDGRGYVYFDSDKKGLFSTYEDEGVLALYGQVPTFQRVPAENIQELPQGYGWKQ